MIIYFIHLFFSLNPSPKTQ